MTAYKTEPTVCLQACQRSCACPGVHREVAWELHPLQKKKQKELARPHGRLCIALQNKAASSGAVQAPAAALFPPQLAGSCGGTRSSSPTRSSGGAAVPRERLSLGGRVYGVYPVSENIFEAERAGGW